MENSGVIRLEGICFRDFGVGVQEGYEVLESEGRVVGAVEGVRIEMEYGFAGGGGCGGDDRFRQAGADNDQIKVRWVDRGVGLRLRH